MLTGFDLALARQVNQTANRIRGLYTQIHPALEAVVGPWLEHDAVLEVIAAWPTPADLKRAGKSRIDARLKKHGCRRHATWAARSSRPWNARVSLSPALTPQQWCYPTWPGAYRPALPAG